MRWFALILVACGGAQPVVRETVERDPEWAIDYQARAKLGCACADAACLEAARGELAKLEADHGGLDDAPPDVQTAHAAFDACWRAGTRDPARDAAYSATEICGCTTSECVQKWKLDAMHMFDKYGVPDGDGLAKLAPDAGSACQRAAQCKAKVTVTGRVALAMTTHLVDEVCACSDLDCARRAMARGSAMYLDIDYGDVTEAQLGAESQRFCSCIGAALGNQLASALPAPLSFANVSLSVNCR